MKEQFSNSIQKIAEAKEGLSKAFLIKANLFKEISEVLSQMPQILSTLVNLVLTRKSLEENLEGSQSALVEAESSFSTLKNSLEESEKKLSETRSEAKQLLGEAKKYPLTDEIKAKFENLPETLEELDSCLAEAEALAALSSSVSYKVIEEWESRRITISNLKEKHLSTFTEKNTISTQLMGAEENWCSCISKMIDGIDQRFSSSFTSINCEGKVVLGKLINFLFVLEKDGNKHYERWGIQIFVKFRAGEKLSQLDSERQSGGERSVSTILYLMALQQYALCPFRIVDEINQGMDPRNERLVHKLIVHALAPVKEGGINMPSQYFLITPKLLLDLEYAEHTKLLCIMNGPGLSASDKLEQNLTSF